MLFPILFLLLAFPDSRNARSEPLLLATAPSRYRIKGTGAKAERRVGVGERGGGRRQELHSPPTHAAPPLSFSLPRALPRKTTKGKGNSLSPTPLLHETTRIPIRVLLVVDVGDDATVPRGEPATQRRGLGSPEGWTPRSAATSSVSFRFAFELPLCFLIRFGSQEEDAAAL